MRWLKTSNQIYPLRGRRLKRINGGRGESLEKEKKENKDAIKEKRNENSEDDSSKCGSGDESRFGIE